MKTEIPKSFTNKLASWYTRTVLCSVDHPEYGRHYITDHQIKHSDGEYKNQLYSAIKASCESGDITNDMIEKYS
jgi:hypothetical protein